MPMQMLGALAVAGLAMSGLWSANDPFVGKWKLDAARSVIVDQMIVETTGPNTYTFRFEGSPAETVTADGTDQPGLPGTTLAAKAEGPRGLKVVRKQGGRTIVSASWTLSSDGRTLRDAFTGVQPDGSPMHVDYLYRRVARGSGFAGTWESTTPQIGLSYEIEIQPGGGAGLSFHVPGSVKAITFDGKDHPVTGAQKGLTASGRRSNARALGYTERVAGKVLDSRTLQLSPDGKTLTMTIRRTGQSTPDALVFERV